MDINAKIIHEHGKVVMTCDRLCMPHVALATATAYQYAGQTKGNPPKLQSTPLTSSLSALSVMSGGWIRGYNYPMKACGVTYYPFLHILRED